jgi:hypothetical protein
MASSSLRLSGIVLDGIMKFPLDIEHGDVEYKPYF